MGDDRYDDSAALCQFHLSVKQVLSGAVPMLLLLIDDLLVAACCACLGSSKGMMSPLMAPKLSNSTT